MLSRFTRALLPLVPLAMLAACAEDTSAPVDQPAGIDDEELNLIGVARRANGNEVRFYEPNPGQIGVFELGQAASLPKLADAVGMFRAAAPGVAVPAALVEAQARVTAARAIDTGSPAARDAGTSSPTDELIRLPVKTEAAAASNPCGANEFVEQECTFGDQYWCKVTWSNGFYAYNSSVDWMHNAVCTLSGTVTLRLLVDSALKASYEIPTGYKGKHIWYGTNYSFRSEVINASGNTFRVGGAAGG